VSGFPLSSRPEDPRAGREAPQPAAGAAPAPEAPQPPAGARMPPEVPQPPVGAPLPPEVPQPATGAPPPADGSPPVPPAPTRPTPEPTRTLAPAARAFWTLTALIQVLVALVVAGVIGSRVLPDALHVPLALVFVAGALVHVLVLPGLRWRRWRYEVREQEIDLRRGVFSVRRTLVPMNRVQHVDTRRTVVSEWFGLASVVFHTAADAIEIPALSEADAAEIRDRIADLAATAEDPV
jgi:membrane protein YdbS with pleckstrin-like domain